MSSDFSIHSTSAAPPVQPAPPVAPPKPPKSQSDHKALNETTSPRGPAVVLSGALAKSVDKGQKSSPNGGGSSPQEQGQGHGQASSQTASTGQHINHVI
jgi:hypothetical protein